MNSKFLNAIVLLGLVLTISASRSSFARLEQIKSNEFAQDFLGQQIVDTVLLQQQAGGTADVVVRLLNGLVQNLNEQQQKHDQEHTQKNAGWEEQLKSYRATVKQLSDLIEKLSTKILNVEKNIRLSEHNIEVVQSQQRLVNQKQADLRAARNVDKQAFQKRNTRQTEMLKGVNFIISELNVALTAKAFVQLDNIKQQLAQLTKTNPLQALVQLTMTFQPASVKYAIQKLSEIKNSLEASIKDDIEGESKAQHNFQLLDEELTSFLHQAAKEQARLEALLAKQRAHLKELQTQRAEAKAQRKAYRELISQVLSARNLYNQVYTESKSKRAKEVATIQKVIGIIQEAEPQTNSAESLQFTLKRK